MTDERRPTIRDVAAASGVSVATVSNVVNGNPKVGTETRHKVLAAIESVGYQASRAARSLRSGRTYLLGYRLGREPNAALDVFLHHMVATAVDADLEVVLLSERDGDPVEPYRAMVQRGGADGFILEGVSYDDPRIPFLEAQGIPFACFGRVDGREDIPWVDIDGAGGTSTAVRHVLGRGCRSVDFVGWPTGDRVGDEREHGYLSAIGADPAVEATVHRIDDTLEAGRRLALELGDALPDAFVCVSDATALGVMAGLRERSVVPGREVAVTGFDDSAAALLSLPGLTSLRQPMDVVGTMLVDRIVARLRGAKVPSSATLVPDLIVRGSTLDYETSP